MTIGRIIDVSSNNHPNGALIDWPAVAKAGVTTAIIKATQGTTYTNSWYQTDVIGARAAGLDVCAYHFADFVASPQEEADYFLSVAGKLAQCLDVETSSNVAWSRSFLQALGRPQDELLIYGSQSSLSSWYAQVPAMPWVAAYQAHSPGWGVLWQFTDNASIPGITGPVDQSNWQGSQIQYDTLFGVYDPVPVPPPPPQPPTITGDNMADGPTVEVTDGTRHVYLANDAANLVYHWWQPLTGTLPNGNWYSEILHTPS